MLAHGSRALRVRQLSLLAAALAYAASYVKPPGADVAAVFGILAVLLFAASVFLDEPGRLAGAWVAPTIAAAAVLASRTAMDQRLVAMGIAGITVLGSLGYPATATAVNLRDRVQK